jgi:hypothetical protein
LLTIDGRPIYTDYIKIENLKQFLTEVPLLHPDSPQYTIFWSKETKKCIEGLWGEMFEGFRFMPGNLYYYGNYTLIQQTDKGKLTRYLKPRIDDIEWELAYMSLEAKGLSGWSKDETFTSLSLVKELNEAGILYPTTFIEENYPDAIAPDGSLKIFIDPRENIRKIHTLPKGKPLYHNPSWNIGILGTRGGGKSFYTALGEVEYGIIFDGAKEFSEEFIRGNIMAEYCLGSANSDKSSEFASKVDASIRAKASPELGRQFGVWGKEGDDDFTPCPFFKDMTGSIATNNKKNPYRHEYKVELNGRWTTKGTGTKLYHVNYSPKKGDGAQAAAGGRYLLSVEEEWGLEENAIEIHNSNDSTVSRDGIFFGVQWKMGTSGNIEYVQSTKKMFLNPKDYRILSFKNHHGTEGQDGQIGFFLPFYMVLRQYKDKDGNTDYEAVAKHVNKLRKDKSTSSDPKVLRDEKMNRPCFVDEMWASDKTYYLPYEEAALREKELMAFGYAKTLENPVKLIWDANSPRGVRYEIDHDAEPYREFPIDISKKRDPSGAIVIYDFPFEINNDVPSDMYQFVGLDPYVEEDIDRGGSIGAAFIICNPKYIPYGAKGNCIAATYIGKPINGLSAYYENLLKLMTFYNCGPQSLWFEKNRGEACRDFFIRKNKLELLCVTPQYTMGSNIYQKNLLSFGYVIGNKISKLNQLKVLNDFLLEETELADGKKKNISRVPCLFTIRQIMQYDIDGNFDAVDGLRGAVMGLKEYESKVESRHNRQISTSGRFNHLINNPKIFKNVRTKRLYEANRS